MGDVIGFTGATRLDSDPERVMRAAIEAGLEGVVIMGYTRDGKEYFSSSYADAGDAVWLARRLEHKLMKIVDSMAQED